MSKPISIRILNSIFKIISFFLPVKKRVLFLGSPRSETLMENTQLVYDKLNCEKKIIIKTLPHSLFDIAYISFYIMASKVIVLDDSYRYFAYIPLKNKQKLVQIWHGPGAFKKMILDLPNQKPYDKYTNSQYDDFVASSPHISEYIESGLGLNPNQINPLGYPRSDLLLNNKEELEEKFYKEFPNLKNKNIIIYLPTFRRYGGSDTLDYDYEINWEILDKFLGEKNTVMIVKKHPLNIYHGLEIVPKECENIIDVGEISYFPMMVASDILITDFSSVFFDYLLLDKPIIFYCPDAKEYLEKHGVYLKFPEELPGDYCQNFDELIDTLKNGQKDIDYSEFKKRYMESCDGHSTQRVVELIEGYLD